MAKNISLLGADYQNVPSILLPQTGGGQASFVDITDTTAEAGDVLAGKFFYNSQGQKTEGTASGGGGVVITDTTDASGGTIRTITATAVRLQAKTNISPTTSSQTIEPSEGYTGLSSVQINAMPAMTLPTSAAASAISGYSSKATIGRSTSDQYINIPTGYNDTEAYYKVSAVPNGSVTAPSTISGSSATVSTGTNTLTLNKTVSVTPSVSTAGYVSSGTAGNSSVSLTASVTTKGATTYHPSTSDQTIASGTYTTGTQTVKAVTISGLSAANIKKDVVVKIGDSTDDDCVTSVTGTYEGGGSGKNIQYSMGRYEVSATSYTATSLSIKVSKAGSYKCYWTMDRNTTSGTSGTQLYKNGSAVGSAHTSWTYNNNNRYGMNCEETLTFAVNDTIVVRARSRSTSYICGAENLIIIEQ